MFMTAWAMTVVVAYDEPNLREAARHGDICCVPWCSFGLVEGQVAYSPIELSRNDALPGRNEPWACWRHFDTGFIVADPSKSVSDTSF